MLVVPTLPAPLDALVDPRSRGDVFVLAQFEPAIAAVDPSLLVAQPPPGSENRIMLFERWLRLHRYTDEGRNSFELPAGQLSAAITEYIIWRARPVSDDHPLLMYPAGEENAPVRRERIRTPGWRQSTSGGKKHTLYHDLKALRWWAERHGLPDDLCDGAESVPAAESMPRRSLLLTDRQVTDIVRVLLDRRVPLSIGEVSRREAWHARQLAAFLIQLWGSLRVSELSKLEDRHLAAAEDHLVVHVPRTKTGAPRTFKLWLRDDAACPVAALVRWLEIARACGYRRGGLLLPRVLLRASPGQQPLGGPAPTTERTNFHRVLRAAGVRSEESDAEDWACQREHFGTHGLRALLPTRAVEAGYSIGTIKQLGGWAQEQTVYDHYIQKRPSGAAATLIADRVAQTAAGDGSSSRREGQS